MLFQETRGRNDESWSAEAALLGVVVNERLHYRSQRVAFGQALDGGDLLSLCIDCKHGTGIYGFAVHQHSAGTANATVADAFCAGQIEVVAQSIEQRHSRFELRMEFLAVHGKLNRDLAGAMDCDIFTRGFHDRWAHEQRHGDPDAGNLHEVASRHTRGRPGLARIVIFHGASILAVCEYNSGASSLARKEEGWTDNSMGLIYRKMAARTEPPSRGDAGSVRRITSSECGCRKPSL